MAISNLRAPALLFAGVFLFSGLSPVGTSFDSRWTVYQAMNLLRRGTTDLDNVPGLIRSTNFYAMECVDADGHVRMGPPEACDGHWYSHFPVGVPVLAAPLIWAMAGVIHLLQPALAGVHASQPVIEAFLHGDFDVGHPLVEMEVASLFLAATAVVIYFIARITLPVARAVALAVLFGCATSAYSVGGRALWQHTPSMLLIAIAILLLLRAEQRPELPAWSAIPAALTYTVRPTNALFVIVVTLYIAVRHRRVILRYLIAAAPVAAAFLAFNFTIYHGPLSTYYRNRLDGFLPRHGRVFGEALAGNLISPSRGLLIFTPVFLLAIWSMLRGKWKTPLSPWLAGWALVHWLVVSAYVENWWAGHSYGPRFFTDLTPVFVLFLIPYFERWELSSRSLRAGFVGLALIGFAIHLRGGWSPAVYRWNVVPDNIDQHPARTWDWKHPQFLAGIGSGGESRSSGQP